jgi:hypothetical protein
MEKNFNFDSWQKETFIEIFQVASSRLTMKSVVNVSLFSALKATPLDFYHFSQSFTVHLIALRDEEIKERKIFFHRRTVAKSFFSHFSSESSH